MRMRPCVRALLGAGVIPWIAAGPTPPPTPALAPACRLAQLRVSTSPTGVFFDGGGGALVGQATFRNVGAPCALVGRPHVRMVGGGARRSRQRETVLPATANGGGELPATFSTRALPRGRRARVTFWWRNWCGPRSNLARRPYPPPAAIELTLASGDVVRLGAGAISARCDAAPLPSELQVGSFEPVAPQPVATAPLPLRLALDRSAYRVERGHTLRYRVTITNTSRRSFRFASCPVYDEQLASHPATAELHYLNCGPAPMIAAGGHVVYAIELRLRHGVAPGRDELVFALGAGTAHETLAPGARVDVLPA